MRRWLSKGGRGQIIQLALFGVALLVFLAFLHFVTRERSDGTSIDAGSALSTSQQ